MKFLFNSLVLLLLANLMWTVSLKLLTHSPPSPSSPNSNEAQTNVNKKQLVKCLQRSNYLLPIIHTNFNLTHSHSQNLTDCPDTFFNSPQISVQPQNGTGITSIVRTGRHGRAARESVMTMNGIEKKERDKVNESPVTGVRVDAAEPNLRRQRFGEHCECWNSSDGLVREVECSCTHLPSRSFVLQDVHRLTLENSGTFTTLSNDGIRLYADHLLELILNDLPLFHEIKDDAFIGLPNLTTIYIVGAPALTHISQGVFKCFIPKLKSIKIVHTGLEITPMFNQLHTDHHLDSVDLENNKIKHIDLNWVNNLKTAHLNLNYNNLRSIGPAAFKGATIARLSLKGNSQLTSLHPDCFAHVDSLRQLDLSETSIVHLPTHGLKNLEILILEKVFTLTVIPSIYHFENLQEALMTFPYHCCAFKYPETHDPVEYQKFKEFVLKVETENCGTSPPQKLNEDHQIGHEDDRKRTKRNILPVLIPRQRHQQKRGTRVLSDQPGSGNVDKTKYHNKIGFLEGSGEKLNENHVNDSVTHHQDFEKDSGHNSRNDFDPFVFDPDRGFGKPMESSDLDTDKTSWETEHTGETEITDEFGTFHSSFSTIPPPVILLCGNVAVKKVPVVKCSPVPDAFSPCEDIMGNNWLRVAVWFVVLFSLLGNSTVLIVLFLSISRVNVQRLLIANLAWSDFCMAIYLFMVAAEDLLSLGVYFNHAIDWQLGWGCQIAGFLTVFASELSVFTLTVITGERWYALTRAIHLTKRLTIGGAAKLMAVGWFLAFILALLPLIGVSSYSKTSICLPMEANTVSAQVYLVFLLIFNGLAFILVTIAYLKMYKAVAGHGHGGAAPAAHTADLAIAKKMALLVFTNFACWAPVAFFGLTAVSGSPLIGVTEAKILLVFFYPLNSILNPYLYAILTKQFRRDFYMLLSRHGLCTELAAKHRKGAASTNNTVQTMQTTLRIGSVSVTESGRVAGRMSMSSASGGGDEHHSPLLMGKGGFVDENNSASNNRKSSKSCFNMFGHSSANQKEDEDKKKSSSSHLDEQLDSDFAHRDGFSAETSFISVPSTDGGRWNGNNRRLKHKIEPRLPPIDDTEVLGMTTFNPSSNV